MRYIQKLRILAGRTVAAGRGKRRRLLFLAAGLLLFWGVLAEMGLSAVSPELVQEAAGNYLLTCLNRASDEALRGGENCFVTVSKSGQGEITALTVNAGEMNRLKAEVLEILEPRLNGRVSAWVPIGSLTEIALFSGRGPKIPIRLSLDGAADVSFQTEFVSAGVNQTCHRIVMTLHAAAFSHSRRFEAAAEAETSTVLAETVLVGDVPGVRLNWTDQ